MAERSDEDTKQLVAEVEALMGESAKSTGGDASTRELVDSAERLIKPAPPPPKLSPVPLLLLVLVVAILSVLGVYSAFGTAM
ncbi:MAG: hypothetical protein AAFP04_13950 [Myxococcota bacterium]